MGLLEVLRVIELNTMLTSMQRRSPVPFAFSMPLTLSHSSIPLSFYPPSVETSR